MYKRKFLPSRKFVSQERRKALILACILFWSVLCAYYSRDFFLGSVEIEGQSMFPTYQNGNRHLFHAWPYFFTNPKRGDVVALKDPLDQTLMVKRVIALPGEQIQIADNKVFINGVEFKENYLTAVTRTHGVNFENRSTTISKDHYFVMGDNRPHSEDSRFFGSVHRKSIVGKIFEKHPS